MGEIHPPLPAPPQWSLTLGSLGRGLIAFGLVLFLFAALSAVLGRKTPQTVRPATAAFVAGCLALFASFAILGTLFAFSRLEYQYVSAHSDSNYGLAYRIAGIWAGQQGSFLLWAVCSALFGLLYLGRTGKYRAWYLASFSVFLAALCGILSYETPFNLHTVGDKPFVPEAGSGLVPALYNYWVVIHPPTIFLGFGALTVFAMAAFAAVVTGDLESWVPAIRPLALANVAILGLGLCMGGFWAYETLGWGGFWAWDPVENTSFVPWCLNVAFVHGLLVQTVRRKWQLSNALLGGISFLSFVYGTFLTRSGLLSDASVHSFAKMDKTAYLFLLGFLFCGLLAFLAAWTYRAFQWSKIDKPPSSGPASRESLIRNGLVFLLFLAGSAAIGMSVPMIQMLVGKNPKNVDEHLYHVILTWFFVPLLLFMAVAPFASWASDSWKKLVTRFLNSFILSFGLLGILMIVFSNPAVGVHADKDAVVTGLFGLQVGLFPWVMFLTWLCLFVAVASVWRLVETLRQYRVTLGAMLSHLGVAVLMAGLILSRGFEKKASTNMSENMPGQALGYTITYADTPVSDELYWTRLSDRNNKLRFHVVGPPIEQKRLAVGQTADFDGVRVTYVKPTREGMPGQVGTKFGAQLLVSGRTKAEPSIELQPTGAIFHAVPLAKGRFLVLSMVDAKTQGIELSLAPGFVAEPGHYFAMDPAGNPNPMVWPHIERLPSHDVYFTLHPQVIEASERVTFRPGETKQLGPLTATYLKPTRKGQPGQLGTEFGALVKFATDAGSTEANPVLRLTEQGVEPEMVPAAPGFLVAMSRMDAATQSVDLQLLFSKPLYQIDLYYKPMTILVWLGTGILVLGGLISAVMRRPKASVPATDPIDRPSGNDATLQPAEIETPPREGDLREPGLRR